jgi:hypothetical protein
MWSEILIKEKNAKLTQHREEEYRENNNRETEYREKNTDFNPAPT